LSDPRFSLLNEIVGRLGDQVEKDIVSVRIGPEMHMAVVATPAYFAKHWRSRAPEDLTARTCTNLWLPTRNGLYA
jgi:DNA-binding transcriptional LysR family regulator